MPLDNPSRASSLNVDAATERTWPHMLVSDSSHKNHLSLSAFPIKNLPSLWKWKEGWVPCVEENMVR